MLMSSEEANRSQARNALLLLGSKADPFERRGVSSIFKEFFAFAIVHGNSLDTVSKARLQKFVVTRKIFYERSKYSNFNRNDRKRKKSEKKKREENRYEPINIIGNASYIARNFPINLRQW